MESIGIIGAGNVGAALAKRLVECGYLVKVANSKGPQSLKEFAGRTGAVPVDMTTDVHLLIIAIPFSRIGELSDSLAPNLPKNLLVIDAGNYYPLRDGRPEGFDEKCPETEWVSRRLDVAAIKAFNNIIASRLETQGRSKGDIRRIALPVSGGSPSGRAAVMSLVEKLGFDAFDAGEIETSWRQQPGMPAYCTDPTLMELPQLLRRADRAEGIRNRDNAAKLMARLPLDYPAKQLVLAARFTVGLDRMKVSSWLAMLRLFLAMLMPKFPGR
jgi:predicted dinucleotide-binding enzyme